MEVIWSPQAKKDFWNNIDYLEAEWTFKDVVNFIEKVEKTINLLKKSNINLFQQIIKRLIK
jgi:plasmid stabilization system protein ParE